MWIDTKGSTVLPASECLRLLAMTAKAGGIGRLGVSTDQAPLVIPVNFTLRDGQVLVRTGKGFVTEAANGHLVAFEVDHVDVGAGTAWSVLIRGLATLTEAPTELDLAAAAHPLVPKPGDMVLVVRPDILSGRQFELSSPTSG
jgi:hypothetical protein